MKYLFLLFFFLFQSACSFDTSSNLWNESQNAVIVKNNDVLINENLKFERFKRQVLEYSNKDDYPDITK